MMRILPVIVLLAVFLTLSEKSYSQSFDPTICDNGDDTEWTGPITAIGVGLPSAILGCTDANCIVTIKYYERMTSWGYEFQIYDIDFDNCDAACMANPWQVALWMIAYINQGPDKMNIDEVDECYTNFSYTAATCWQHNVLTNKYTACGGECCIGTYEICRRSGPNGDYFEINQTDVAERDTYNCTPPCNFVDCSTTMPLGFTGPAEMPNGNIGVFYPKQGIYQAIPSKSIKFHPNPTDDNLSVTLDLPEDGVYTISVYDNRGIEMFKQKINSNSKSNLEIELKTAAFSDGVYNVVVTGDNGEIMSGKFIKVK